METRPESERSHEHRLQRLSKDLFPKTVSPEAVSQPARRNVYNSLSLLSDGAALGAVWPLCAAKDMDMQNFWGQLQLGLVKDASS